MIAKISLLAHFENGKLTVWASTQSPFGVQPQVAEAVGCPPKRCA